MSRRHTQIGLDRLVRLEWLEQTALLALAGMELSAAKAVLSEKLQDSFRSPCVSTRGSLDKTLTILTRIWMRPPEELEPLRKDGLALMARLPPEMHLPVHWGMTMAVYPFWGVVADQVGRLLRLQEAVLARQIQLRLREQYGERETVSRRVRYVLRSFIDWGVLAETDQSGAYRSGTRLAVVDEGLIAWLVEAVLHSYPDGAMPAQAVLNSPRLFPFALQPMPARRLGDLAKRLDVIQHGLDQELLMLRNKPEL